MILLLSAFAEVGVCGAADEEAERDEHEDDIKHRLLPLRAVRSRVRRPKIGGSLYKFEEERNPSGI
jgi:hypothetical protein